MCNNRQSAALSLNENQLQVILSGILGDGCIPTSNSNSTYFMTNCKYLEYINFKKDLLGDFCVSIKENKKNGYNQTPIWIMRSKSNIVLKTYKSWSIPLILSKLTSLGLALWIYDDGSLHKKNLFYNLNTQSFSKEDQENYFIPYFNTLHIYPKLQIERKKDGRIFYYLRIGKFSGADKITKILEQYPIKCYSYKRWSSETIHNWSKFQEELKSTDIDFNSLTSQGKTALFRRLSI